MKKDKKQIFLFTEIFALEKKQYDPKLINEIDSDKHVIPSNYKSAAQCSLDNRPTKKLAQEQNSSGFIYGKNPQIPNSPLKMGRK
jgi:hypothetical protein